MSANNKTIIWLERYLRVTWWMVGGCGLILCGILLWSPTVDPVAPGENALVNTLGVKGERLPDAGANEFVTRPLFVTARRPLVLQAGPVVETVEVSTAPTPQANMLEDVTLHGVFSSDGSQGVILREGSNVRRRLMLGDELGEWTLAAVEPRGAVFRSGVSEARLSMGLLAAGLGSAVGSGFNSSVKGINAEGQTQEQGEPAEVWVPTFENIYRKKSANRFRKDTDNGPADSVPPGEAPRSAD